MSEFKIEIDKNRLDEEWVDQPRLFHEHAVAAAEARKRWEQAKARLDITRAEFDIEMRRDPETYDLPKVTEGVLASAILLQGPVKDAMKVVINAREEMGILDAAVIALEHRKKALEKLVELQGRDYYSEPRAHGDAGKAMEEVEKRAIRRKGKGRKERA